MIESFALFEIMKMVVKWIDCTKNIDTYVVQGTKKHRKSLRIMQAARTNEIMKSSPIFLDIYNEKANIQ